MITAIYDKATTIDEWCKRIQARVFVQKDDILNI